MVKKSYYRYKGKFYHMKVVINVVSTFNNTHVSVLSLQGELLYKISTGMVGLKKARRGSFYGAELLSDVLYQFLQTKFGNNLVLIIYLSGLGEGRLGVLKFLFLSNYSIFSVSDKTSFPHNGCRKKKSKRV